MWKLLSSRAGTLFLLSVAVAFAETADTKPTSSDETRTTITSQRMTVRNQENKAIFEGAVILTKGALVVHSDHMVVIFKAVDAAAGKSSETAAASPPGNAASHPGARSDELPVMSNRAVSTI